MHLVKGAWRSLRRFRYSTAANALCLTLGFSCSLAGYAVMAYFDASDLALPNSERVVVLTGRTSPPGGEPVTWAVTPEPLARYLRPNLPNHVVARMSDADGTARVTIAGENRTIRIVRAEKDLPHVLGLPLLAGNVDEALLEPASAIITRQAAVRLFGRTSVTGTSLAFDDGCVVTITAVLDDVPAPSHLLDFWGAPTFDLILPLPAISAEPDDQWGSFGDFTYVLLPDPGQTALQELRQQIAMITSRTLTQQQREVLSFGDIPLPKFSEALYRMTYIRALPAGVSFGAVVIICGLLVLLVAAINCANLMASQSADLRKEMALRMVLGESKISLMTQRLTEVAIIGLFALCSSLLVMAMIRDVLLARFSAQLVIPMLSMIPLLSFSLALLVGVVAVTAAYPVLSNLRTKPIHCLEVQRRSGSRGWLSTALLSLQFLVASCLVVLVMTVAMQNQYLRRTVLRGVSDSVVVLNARNVGKAADQVGIDRVRTELMREPGIKAVSSTNAALWRSELRVTTQLTERDKQSAKTLSGLSVGQDYFKVMGLSLLAGRDFSAERDRDAALTHSDQRLSAVILDMAALNAFGLSSPQAAIGKTLNDGNGVLNVIGVVDTMPAVLGSSGQNGSMYSFSPSEVGSYVIKMDKNAMQQGLRHIDTVWKNLANANEVDRRFLSEVFQSATALFFVIYRIVLVLALLAIAISVMGMMSMAAHLLERRTYEIGIRKCLGASNASVFILLLREFSLPLIVSGVVGVLVGAMLASAYLNLFAVRLTLGPSVLLASLGIGLSVSSCVLIIKTIRTVLRKPANILRYE